MNGKNFHFDNRPRHASDPRVVIIVVFGTLCSCVAIASLVASVLVK